MTYTSEERVLAVLNGEIPDRVPIFDYLIHDGVFEKVGFKDIKPGDIDSHLAACAKCLDLCHSCYGTPYVPSETINDDGSKTRTERWMSWRVPAPSAVVSEDVYLARLKQQIEWLESGGPAKDYIHAKKRYDGDMIYVCIGANPSLPYDNTEHSIYLYSDYPELVERRMALENQKTMELLQETAFPELSPVALFWADIAYKGGLFYPLDVLERLVFPAIRDMCDLLHSRGIKVVFHSDGNLTSILPQLVNCGIDGLNPLEISAGMDYVSFKEDYGSKVVLVGGMDAVDALAFGTIDEVVAETKRLIDVAGRGGGLIAASSSGQIDDSMPTDNVMAYFETIWEYGKY